MVKTAKLGIFTQGIILLPYKNWKIIVAG